VFVFGLLSLRHPEALVAYGGYRALLSGLVSYLRTLWLKGRCKDSL